MSKIEGHGGADGECVCCSWTLLEPPVDVLWDDNPTRVQPGLGEICEYLIYSYEVISIPSRCLVVSADPVSNSGDSVNVEARHSGMLPP